MILLVLASPVPPVVGIVFKKQNLTIEWPVKHLLLLVSACQIYFCKRLIGMIFVTHKLLMPRPLRIGYPNAWYYAI